jgi:hypothetical protein
MNIPHLFFGSLRQRHVAMVAIVLTTITLDSLFSNVSDLSSEQMTEGVRILIFSVLVACIVISGRYLLTYYSRRIRVDLGLARRDLTIVSKVITIIQIILSIALVLLLLQIILTLQYYTAVLTLGMITSYLLGSLMLGLLHPNSFYGTSQRGILRFYCMPYHQQH